ncbi:hypothetical protein IGI39_003061 [Enterococcus sp. AZ135]|uniref:DUF2922 family protein n=1 Tax=unclassified Enterococcus TaxID=2608891 RepID=UPI003F20275E
MTHDLVTTYLNSLGNKHNWTYKDVDNDLPDEVIKEACELLTNLDIFEQNGVKLFDSVVTAKIVTTTETELFDNVAEESTDEFTDTSTNDQGKVRFFPTYPKAIVDNVDKPEENYSHSAVSVDKSAVHSLKPTVPRIEPHSLIKNATQTGKQSITKTEERSAVDYSEQLPEQKPAKDTERPVRLLDRLRNLRNRNKEDPLDRPPDNNSRG